jgi:xanthine dehydrogenase YagT iron-sulfur-binding subunit
MNSSKPNPGAGATRREFVSVTIGGTVVAVLPSEAMPATQNTCAVAFKINGREHQLEVDPRTTVLDLLRDQLGLTGTKKGCDHGQCGACTVLLDGERRNSCLMLAVMQQGKEITTIEGIAQGDQLHPVQQCFIKHDGFQCGYCTPGQICSAVALLHEVRSGAPSFVTGTIADPKPAIQLTDDEIRERMSGNICRCGAYPGIVAAIKEAHGAQRT